jgi:PAS domain S-box-containing protein
MGVKEPWPPRLLVSRCSSSPDAKGKWGCELSSSEETSGRKLAGGFRLAVVLVALCCVAVLGYMAGIRQPKTDAGESPKTYALNLGSVHLNLTVGAMGVAVIFTLTILVAAAVLLAAVASRRRRQAGVLLRDIAARKRTERELQESEERFRLLVNGVRDYAIFMLDSSGQVASWNQGAERIKGYKANEIVGRHFSCFYPPEDVQNGNPERELQRAIAEGHYEEEGWRIRKDGSRFWANVVITALRDGTGKLRGFSKITRDVTEHRRAEELSIAGERRAAPQVVR